MFREHCRRGDQDICSEIVSPRNVGEATPMKTYLPGYSIVAIHDLNRNNTKRHADMDGGKFRRPQP